MRAGYVSFGEGEVLGCLRARPSFVSIVHEDGRDRDAVERFIVDVYAKTYKASIRFGYPELISIRGHAGDILAATGFRPASSGPLFLEQYLEHPIEQILNVPRSEIVEIGGLASAGGGASLYLYATLAVYLYCKGFTQAVVTSTRLLERRFQQMGFQPQRLARADPALLASSDENWGTYYDTRPYVISGSVARGYERLRRQIGVEFMQPIAGTAARARRTRQAWGTSSVPR